MNEIKNTSDSTFNSLNINGVWFNVYKEVSFVVANTKSGERRVNTFTVFVSPDYNPCASYKFEANSIKGLAKKLNKLQYRIVKPTTNY